MNEIAVAILEVEVQEGYQWLKGISGVLLDLVVSFVLCPPNGVEGTLFHPPAQFINLIPSFFLESLAIPAVPS